MTKKLIRTPAGARRIAVTASNASGRGVSTITLNSTQFAMSNLKAIPNEPEPTREIDREVVHLRAHVAMATDLLRELSNRLVPVLANSDARTDSGSGSVTPITPDTPLGADLRSISDEVFTLILNLRGRLSQLQL